MQVDPYDIQFDYTPQTQQFQQWWQLFNEQLTRLAACTEHHIIPYLRSNNYPLIDSPLVWVCFDEFTPQQLNFQDFVVQQQQAQYRYELNTTAKVPQLYAAQDNQDELQQLMAWLEQKLAAEKQRMQ